MVNTTSKPSKKTNTAPKTGRKTSRKAPHSVADKKSVAQPTIIPSEKSVTPTEKLKNRLMQFFPKDNIFRLFLRGWKKTFILRGRASRYELWCFMIINCLLCTIAEIACAYIFSPRFLQTANQLGISLDNMEIIVNSAEILFYACLLIPLFPLGSLLIRRMHDLNKLAWRNYLEPVFMGSVTLSMINMTITSLENTAYDFTNLLLSACFIGIFYSVCYYSLKFLIMTLFYPGNPERNDYGDSQFNDKSHEELSLKFCCWYILYMATLFGFYLIIILI